MLVRKSDRHWMRVSLKTAVRFTHSVQYDSLCDGGLRENRRKLDVMINLDWDEWGANRQQDGMCAAARVCQPARNGWGIWGRPSWIHVGGDRARAKYERAAKQRVWMARGWGEGRGGVEERAAREGVGEGKAAASRGVGWRGK